ncbi:hypothetical protein Tco_0567269 [Tanacetum coccineum]
MIRGGESIDDPYLKHDLCNWSLQICVPTYHCMMARGAPYLAREIKKSAKTSRASLVGERLCFKPILTDSDARFCIVAFRNVGNGP